MLYNVTFILFNALHEVKDIFTVVIQLTYFIYDCKVIMIRKKCMSV